MTKREVELYFGWPRWGTHARIARALGLTQVSVYLWKKVPPLRQLQLEEYSHGLLIPDPGIRLKRPNASKPSRKQKEQAAQSV